MALMPTPGLPEFDYIQPASLEEASQFLAQHQGQARPLLGGTDTFVRMRDGFWKEKYIVDIKNLEGMSDIGFNPDSGLSIGAAVTMNQVAASAEVQKYYPVLAQAANSVASYQLRNRATLVGNICNASPAGDTIGASLLLDGVLKVHGVEGVRDEPLSTFFLGPGKTTLKAGDIVTAVTFPLPPENHAAGYIKLGRNNLGDLAIVGVTALGYPDGSVPSGYRFRIALASVAPVPFIAGAAEKVLTAEAVTEKSIATAAQAAMDAVTPIDDTRGSARYRKLMVRNLVKQAVTDVWEIIKTRG